VPPHGQSHLRPTRYRSVSSTAYIPVTAVTDIVGAGPRCSRAWPCGMRNTAFGG
jgi:hypothetical protein